MAHFSHFPPKAKFSNFPKRHFKKAHLVNGTFGKWHISHIFAEFGTIFQMFLKGLYIKRHIRQMANSVNGTYPAFSAGGKIDFQISLKGV